ncbi:MAG: hypothetical protein CSB55_01465 [Candidatus Cloacimonadota bacterium]|nr:MAG: hypothetical protein CSB55_01465 [Candidatus Cloacimonadota bacterium]
MKIIVFALIFTSILLFLQAQERFELKADYDFPKENEEIQMNYFQGIEKLKFSLNENDKKYLNGKDYILIIKEYQDGKLFKESIVADTEKERLPKIDSDFQFSLIAQNILNYEKIGFFFPKFMNKKIFAVKSKFKDGDFSLRKINIAEGIEFELNKPFQIALITPPNRDPDKGYLGYCEISQGEIDVEKWYAKYKISQFFLIYMEIRQNNVFQR